MSSSVQPVAARVVKTPVTGSGRSMQTFSKPTASEMPSQTDCRIASAESVSVSRDETCRSWRSARAVERRRRGLDARSAGRARRDRRPRRGPPCRRASAACPSAGSPTEMIPSRWPSVWRIGTNSSSAGCHASGSVARLPVGDVAAADVVLPVERRRAGSCTRRSRRTGRRAAAPRPPRRACRPAASRRASSLPCTVVTSKSFQAGRYVLTTTVRNPSEVAIVPAIASMMVAVSVSARTSLVTSSRARRRAMAERSFEATAGVGGCPPAEASTCARERALL